jgi:hypothetical protein
MVVSFGLLLESDPFLLLPLTIDILFPKPCSWMFSLSSLYPSLESTTRQPVFPSSAQSLAILDGDGRLPPSSPIHLALAHLAYEEAHQSAHGYGDREEREEKRVLILTREPGEWASSLLRDGEDWMRTHGGKSGVLRRLDRVDIKFVNPSSCSQGRSDNLTLTSCFSLVRLQVLPYCDPSGSPSLDALHLARESIASIASDRRCSIPHHPAPAIVVLLRRDLVG